MPFEQSDNSFQNSSLISFMENPSYNQQDALLTKMGRHREQLFQRLVDSVEASERELKVVLGNIEGLEDRMGGLEKNLDVEQARWREMFDGNLRDSIQRLKDVGES